MRKTIEKLLHRQGVDYREGAETPLLDFVRLVEELQVEGMHLAGSDVVEAYVLESREQHWGDRNTFNAPKLQRRDFPKQGTEGRREFYGKCPALQVATRA